MTTNHKRVRSEDSIEDFSSKRPRLVDESNSKELPQPLPIRPRQVLRNASGVGNAYPSNEFLPNSLPNYPPALHSPSSQSMHNPGFGFRFSSQADANQSFGTIDESFIDLSYRPGGRQGGRSFSGFKGVRDEQERSISDRELALIAREHAFEEYLAHEKSALAERERNVAERERKDAMGESFSDERMNDGETTIQEILQENFPPVDSLTWISLLNGTGRPGRQSSLENLSRIKHIKEVVRHMENHDILNLVYSDHRLRDAGLCFLLKKMKTMKLDKLINLLGSDDKQWTELLNRHVGMQAWLKYHNGNGRTVENGGSDTKTPGQVAMLRKKKKEKGIGNALQRGEEEEEDRELSEHETKEQKDAKKVRVMDWMGDR